MCDLFMDVPRSKEVLIVENKQRISSLFGVNIELFFNNEIQHNDPSQVSANQNVQVKLEPIVFQQSTIGPEKQFISSTNKAKDYVKSLTGIGSDHCTCIETYSTNTYQLLQRNHDNIERQSQAVVSFINDGSTVLISGQSFNVANAKSLMERMRYASTSNNTTTSDANNRLVVNTSTNLQTQNNQQSASLSHYLQDVVGGSGYSISGGGQFPPEDNINKHTTLMHTLSPGGESSHDSCYDSDCSPSSSRRNSTQRLDTDFHSDVSRTASDTLAAEMAESKEELSKTGSNASQQQLLSTCEEDVIAAEDSSSNGCGTGNSDVSNDYTSKVEFALKLGYTEEQIQSALIKLGIQVDQNALLTELIKLGSSKDHRIVKTADDSSATGSHLYSSSGVVSMPSFVNSSHYHPHHHLSLKGSRSLTLLEKKSYIGHVDHTNLRPIVIDGSNVAMSHGNKEVFSCQGIKLAVDFFTQRCHKEITVFVPQWRKETSRMDSPIIDQDVLYDLEREKLLVFTPARRVGGKRVICYDDRYIIKLAAENGGVAVSNDNYRDLLNESPEYKQVIEERLLMYSFVNDRFMPPDDPLGRYGPTLDQFLRKDCLPQKPPPPDCPYDKKCTYGNKCKFYHPERGTTPHRSVTDRLNEEASIRLKQAKEKGLLTSTNSIGDPRLLAGPVAKKQLTSSKSANQIPQQQHKKSLTRTQSLVPGTFPQTSSNLYTQNSVDNLDIKPSTSPVNSRSLSPSLTLTPVSSQYQQFHPHQHHDNRSSPQGPSRSNNSSPNRSNSPREVSPRGGGRDKQGGGASLRVPQASHWAMNQIIHETLRPVYSDPTSGYYGDIPGATTAKNLHLNLAKNLSDHSGLNAVIVEDSNARMNEILNLHHQQQQHASLSKAASIEEVNQEEGPKGVHRTLQRQLSLKGPEDPRINNNRLKMVNNNSGNSTNSKNSNNVPIVRFHGPLGPVGPVIHHQQTLQQHQNEAAAAASWHLHHPQALHMFTAGASHHMPASSAATGMYQNIQVASDYNQAADLHRHTLLNSTGRRGGEAGSGQQASGALFDSSVLDGGGGRGSGELLQHGLKPPESSAKGHTPLGRMSSAPSAFGHAHSTTPSSSSPHSVPPPAMNRQNSNSDSNLSTQKDVLMSDSDKQTLQGVFGDPRWAFHGSISGQVREKVEQSGIQQQQQQHQQKWMDNQQPAQQLNHQGMHGNKKEADVFYLMTSEGGGGGAAANQHQQLQQQQQQQRIKVAFGVHQQQLQQQQFQQHNQMQRQQQPAMRKHASLGRTASCHAGSGGGGNSGSEERRFLPPQSMVVQSSGGGDNNAVVIQPPGISSSAPSKEQSAPVPLPSTGGGESEVSPPPSQQQSQLPPSNAGNNTAESNDPRHKIFYHLCGLFNDEEKVRRVMDAHPDETNPQVLCAYLLAIP